MRHGNLLLSSMPVCNFWAMHLLMAVIMVMAVFVVPMVLAGRIACAIPVFSATTQYKNEKNCHNGN